MAGEGHRASANQTGVPVMAMVFGCGAIAYETSRTFSNVKSSAMMPRQPSVPKMIRLMASSMSDTSVGVRAACGKFLHHSPDVLRALPRADQQGVRRIDDDQIANPDDSDELIWAPEEIARRVQRKDASRRDVFAGRRREQFVDGCPRADVAPADRRRKNEDGAASRIS